MDTPTKVVSGVAVVAIAVAAFVVGGNVSYSRSAHRLNMSNPSTAYATCTGAPVSAAQAGTNRVDLTCGETAAPTTTTTPPTTQPPAPTTLPPPTTTSLPPPTPTGVESCGLYANAESCWASNTGVRNMFKTDGSRWTNAQIKGDIAVDGHKPSEQLATPTLDGGRYRITTGGTAGSPKVYENLHIHRGCIEIEASNVLLRNVFLDYQYGDTVCHTGAIWAPGIVSTSEANAYTNVRIEDSEFDGDDHMSDTRNIGLPPLFDGTGYRFLRVNMHGSAKILRAPSYSTITYSYIHDVTDGHNYCYFTGGCGGGQDLHSDVIWAQNTSHFSVTHSFLVHDHTTTPQSAGACLCDQNGADVFFEDLYLDGGANAGILFAPPRTGGNQITWHRLYGRDDRAVALGDPSMLADYVSPYGNWTPTTYYSWGGPVMTNSRCGQVYKVNPSGTVTGTVCS